MAKVKSHIHSVMRGSVAGVTYYAGRYCPIMVRQRVVVTNRDTEYQKAIRNGVRSGVAQWELLTPEQHAAWDAYAATCEFPGPIKPYKVPGRQLAIGQYAVTHFHNWLELVPTIALSMETAPALEGRLAISDISVIPPPPGNTGFSISFVNYNGEACYFYANRSMRVSNAKYYFTGPFLPKTVTRIEVPEEPATSRLDFEDLEEDGIYFARISVYSKGVITCKRRMGGPWIVRARAVTVAAP